MENSNQVVVDDQQELIEDESDDLVSELQPTHDATQYAYVNIGGEYSINADSEADDNDINNYKNLKVYISTWNVNTRKLVFSINDLLAFDQSSPPDLCVFGFQEVSSTPIQRIIDYFYNDPWTNELTKMMTKLNYVRLKSTRLVGILLVVFVRRTVLPFVKFCTDDWVRLGFWGLWGNKGANIFSLNVGGLNICFVNSHLSAHEDQSKARIREHSRLMYHKLKLNSYTLDTVSNQDYLFCFGDLNFRVENISIDRVLELIESKSYSELLKHDQLKFSIQSEDSFASFDEAPINFPPTYKFKLDSSTYQTSRLPSWCDRILYKTNERADKFIKCTSHKYDSLDCQFNQSDHKPVYGLFEIRVLNWTTQPASVTFANIKANTNQNLQIVYRVNTDVFTHKKDWIGLYWANFKTYDDYITYTWADRIPELELNNQEYKDQRDRLLANYVERSLEIDQFYMSNGTFVIGYFSYLSNCLIGVSNIFELKLN